MLLKRSPGGTAFAALAAAIAVTLICVGPTASLGRQGAGDDAGGIVGSLATLTSWIRPIDVAKIEADIRQAVQDEYAAYGQCGQEPAACDPSSFLAAGGVTLDKVTRTIRHMASEGYAFSPDRRGSHIRVDSVVLTTPSDAMVAGCLYDAAIVLGKQRPDGSRDNLDDNIVSYRVELRFVLQGERWLLFDFPVATPIGKDHDLCS